MTEENKMAESKMAQVAAMFGKKLGEEFVIEDGGKFTVKFTTEGIKQCDCQESISEYELDCFFLADLLTGRAVIVDEKNDDFTE